MRALQEDVHLARTMAAARRMDGEDVSDLSDSAFLAKIAARSKP